MSAMLPDFATPDTCPTCSAAKSHDVRQLTTLALLGRVYKCGAAVSTDAAGGWFTAIVCRRAGEVIVELRAQNARLRHELDAVAELAEEELGEWIAASPLYVPERLAALHSIYHRASAPAAEAPAEPDHGQAGLELPAASERSGASLPHDTTG